MLKCHRVGLFITLTALTHPAIVHADAVLDWNAEMIDAIHSDNSGPTLSTRNFAILHTAIYDAVNSIHRTHQPYRWQLNPPSATSAEAAAVGAAHLVMRALYPSFKASTENLYATYLATVGPSEAVNNGLALGVQVAQLVLESREADGSQTEVTYIPSDEPGQWRRTPPFFRPPLTPQWRYVTPFCLPNIESFLPPPPPALASPEYADSFNHVKAIGGTLSKVRTSEQSTIAVFWSDFSYTSMPPGHWHEIAATIARDRRNTLAENARLFALLSLAQADSAIVCWEAKYRYNMWRPVTAIQLADADNNSLTEADPTWVQELQSPAFPSYPSGHSTFSKASAQVITHFFQTDAISFIATSDSLPGVFRKFDSLAVCVDEVGMSRVYGGFHFMFDNLHGKTIGKRVGDYVCTNFLLPNESLPRVQLEEFQDGAPRVRVHGHFGRTFVLEVSNDLKDWSSMSTNQAFSGGLQLRDATQPVPTFQYYRVREK